MPQESGHTLVCRTFILTVNYTIMCRILCSHIFVVLRKLFIGRLRNIHKLRVVYLNETHIDEAIQYML